MSFFSREALRAIDHDAVEQYNIPSIVLMENAARNATEFILNSIDHELRENIVVLCGGGNNGGDGYAVSRHLTNSNCNVHIVQLTEPCSSDAVVNASICRAMGIPTSPWNKDICCEALVLIDAMFGTGIDRPVQGVYEDAINTCNLCSSPCISLDIPSGLDCNSGKPLGSCIEATLTISFVGMKQGFMNESAKKFLGDVLIADIGCPITLLEKYGNSPT